MSAQYTLPPNQASNINHGSDRRVHFPSDNDDASLVTSIHTRPYTLHQDIPHLYYTASDIAEFKADYKHCTRMSEEYYHDDDDSLLDLIESNIEEEDDSMEKNDVPSSLDDPDENDAKLNAEETIISRDSTNNIWMTLYDLAMDTVTSVFDDECEGDVPSQHHSSSDECYGNYLVDTLQII